MHNPGKAHIVALKRTLRYLKKTADYGLRYDFSNDSDKAGIYGYYDAAHADCVDSMKSTMAYVFYLESCPIIWNSKLYCTLTSLRLRTTVSTVQQQKQQKNASGWTS